MTWEQVYADAKSVWGEQPDLLLMEIASFVPQGLVLDLGMGEGRNGMYFARHGHDVRGIDRSPAAVAKCREWAEALKVGFQAEVGDIREVVIEPNSLALAICAMSLQFMTLDKSERVMRQIKQGLKPSGMVYVTVFSTDDPGFARSQQTRSEVERHTFYNEAQETNVHFFEPGELLPLFDDLKLHRFAQTRFLDGGHPGAEAPHYHGTLTYIGQRI